MPASTPDSTTYKCGKHGLCLHDICGEEQSCDALASFSVLNRQPPQDSIEPAKKWAFIEEDAKVVAAALKSAMIEDLMLRPNNGKVRL